jgi:hypothetical protein
MSLADLEQLFRERAVDIDDDPHHSWELLRNDAVTRVQAATREVFATAGSAWEAAEQLAVDVLAIGYTMVRRCEIGTVRLDNDPAVEWRGRIDLLLEPSAAAPAGA